MAYVILILCIAFLISIGYAVFGFIRDGYPSSTFSYVFCVLAVLIAVLGLVEKIRPVTGE